MADEPTLDKTTELIDLNNLEVAKEGTIVAQEGEKQPEGTPEGLKDGVQETISTEWTQEKVDAAIKLAVDTSQESVKAGYEGTISEMKTKLRAGREEIQVMRQQNSSATLRKLVDSAEDEYGTKGKTIAEQLVEMDRTLSVRAKELDELEVTLKEQLEKSNIIATKQLSTELGLQYTLTKEEIAGILREKNPLEMRTKAVLIAYEKTKTAAIVPQKIDTGKDVSKGTDLSSKNADARAGAVIQLFDEQKK